MKRFRMYIGILLMASAAVCLPTALQGCKSIVEEPTHPEHAMFDVAELTLAVGETVDLAVKNATAVEVISVGDIVSTAVNGAVISVTGVRDGTTELTARADGQMIRCDITVTALPDVPSAGDSESEADRMAALADDGVRAAVGPLVLRLSEPGNIFKVSSSGLVVTAVSLASGENMTLTLPAPLQEMAGSTSSVPGMTLTLDGTPLTLAEASVEKVTAARVWLRCLTATGTVCRFVLPLRDVG